ncbi:hypothetical protein Curi_c06670 [Gottschalkia acidurici 9a]|uniref:Uncharacterized protein n=1 Tax=Gottschalkia acidurici (strain ATCC 7906 / DSM 604 / BCRC 14475 / CIP 104303 / KCTC 5404 / NCIMB 10678 / 9a) TaxID=1128398 RepID=K0AYA4_GOTA9|nr:hypothetical protein [Gottschalkia acidurici]AFS77740.1 hypothetical protein Curi_c06670 [Gottschalkia acidurici 9a]
MGLLELIIMAMFDVAEYTIVSYKLIYDDMHSYKLNKLLLGLYFIGFSLAIGFSSYLLNGKYNIFASCPLIIIMFFFIYRRKIKEIIYLYGISTVMMIIIQFASIILFRIFSVEIGFNFKSGLLAHTVTLLIIFTIVLYVPINSIFRYVREGNRVFKLLVLNIFIIIVSLLFYWYVDIDSILKNVAIVAIILVWTILVNFIILRNGYKNQVEGEKLKAYEGYLPTINELIKNLRKKQHECDNNIQVLRMTITENEDYKKSDYSEAKKENGKFK